MLSGTTLVLGGAASGKSFFAETLAIQQDRELIYLASAQCFDAEMREKINTHIARRGPRWRTIEEPFDVAGTLDGLEPNQFCLFDCATLWLSNHLLAENDIAAEQARLARAIAACAAPLIVVSNEVGHGIVPENALARQFREAQGRLNIALAAQADRVIQVVAGIPRVLKGEIL